MSGQLLFDRRVRVAVESLLITDLRVSFKVKKTSKKEPNTAEISISNLSEKSRAALQKKSVKVILEAGYVDSIAQIFSGNSRTVDQVIEGPNLTTKINCGDGERAYRYLRVSESFRPGTRVSDVVDRVAQALGMTVTGHVKELRAVTEQFIQGYTSFGKVANELDHLLTSRGFTWSIQDGQIQVLKVDGATSDSVIRLAFDTGLVGSPEHGNPEKQVPLSQVSGAAEDVDFTVHATKRKGPAILKVRSALQPGFAPGRRVKVESRGVNGVFRIQTVEHTGDTASQEWFSDLECLPT
jgi:hypothetical protein